MLTSLTFHEGYTCSCILQYCYYVEGVECLLLLHLSSRCPSLVKIFVSDRELSIKLPIAMLSTQPCNHQNNVVIVVCFTCLHGISFRYWYCLPRSQIKLKTSALWDVLITCFLCSWKMVILYCIQKCALYYKILTTLNSLNLSLHVCQSRVERLYNSERIFHRCVYIFCAKEL